MFEVLAFVYRNYWRGDACPGPQQMGRRLSARGFDDEEIRDALHWLDGLSLATQGVALERHADGTSATVLAHASTSSARAVMAPSADAMRVYSVAEQGRLGAHCLGFLGFLEASGALPAGMREIVIERAMAAPGDPVSLDEFKIMAQMVYWSAGVEPDALVRGELCVGATGRLAH